jgi:hypothetical protein
MKILDKFSLGRISATVTKKIVLLVILLFALVLMFLGWRSWQNSSAECVRCHADKPKMTELGFPQFYMTNETVEKQSKHPNVTCRDCHLGDGRARDYKKAHRGMLKALYVHENGSLIDRAKHFKEPIGPTGDDRIYDYMPKIKEGDTYYLTSQLRNLLWHDRNPETLNFDPDIAAATCGKSNCHPQELSQFKKSVMGANYRQRYMRTWTAPYGPHNCGPSFADLPPDKVLQGAGFDYKNTRDIAQNLKVPFTEAHARDKQKFCNVCHAGCLDCHFTPSPKEGTHSFSKTPPSMNCLGYGRGTSMCHPGAMHSRRGETYIGGDYAIPSGMTPDVHYKKGIHCVDCHQTGEKGMGDIERKASCRDCHIEVEDAHRRGVHKTLDCATCHVNELGGYQITVWGPGIIAGKQNPFKKYSLYYGIQKPPIIIKDQKGVWRPYKIWPHSVGNIKDPAPPSPGLQFRWPNGETPDAYYIVGTLDKPEKNSRHLLWLQLEQAAHPYGKARPCNSCHGLRQVAESKWEFQDEHGAEPFTGEHRIVASGDGLWIEGLKNTSEIKTIEGAALEDFASWLFFKDAWRVPGDFSIRADARKYKASLDAAARLDADIARIDILAKGLDKAGKKKYARLRSGALHDPENSGAAVGEFLRSAQGR